MMTQFQGMPFFGISDELGKRPMLQAPHRGGKGRGSENSLSKMCRKRRGENVHTGEDIPHHHETHTLAHRHLPPCRPVAPSRAGMHGRDMQPPRDCHGRTLCRALPRGQEQHPADQASRPPGHPERENHRPGRRQLHGLRHPPRAQEAHPRWPTRTPRYSYSTR